MEPCTNSLGTPESTGTTIIAIEFDGGVVIGADSRTSMGCYVANRVTDKLTYIHDNIYCCRSGSAADTQAIADIVAYTLNLQEMTTGVIPLVSHAAQQFRNFCYSYRDIVIAGIIVGGWDAKNGGQVYSVPIGGMMKRQPFATGGSGGGYIYGYLNEYYRKNMCQDECVEFVKKAIKHSILHDGCSGGVIRIGIITEKGMERKVFYNTKSGEPVVNGC